MTIQTTQDNLLVGSVCHPAGSVVEVPDAAARRLIERKAATLFIAPAECAAMPAAPESADAAPRPKRKP